MTSPQITVVLPVRGRPERLRATLACLRGCRDGATSFEVVLVDDNDPGGCSVAGQAPPGLTAHTVPGPRTGRAGARNAGARAAIAPWIVFLDADVLVGPDFVDLHAEAAADGVFVHGRLRELPAAEQFLTAVAEADDATVRRTRADLVASVTRSEPRRRVMANALERGVEELDAGRYPGIAPWLGCVGANTGMARSDWARVGGFDEGFGRVWGCEDLELGLRLHQAGVRRRLCPKALGLHLSHARPDRWAQHAENLDRFTRLHPGPEVEALAELLGPRGTPAGYVRKVLELNASRESAFSGATPGAGAR
jgi:GT2 family glycosyltransferase